MKKMWNAANNRFIASSLFKANVNASEKNVD